MIILKKKKLFNLSSHGENKLKKAAFDMGYLEYGNGGLTRFIDDFMQYCVEVDVDILNEFKSQKVIKI